MSIVAASLSWIPLALGVTITNSTLPSGREMVPYSASLGASGGTAPYTWSVKPPVVAWGNGEYDAGRNQNGGSEIEIENSAK